jgi:hypothetical protein
MSSALEWAIEEELRLGHEDLAAGELDRSFRHLERAHVLGQRNTRLHVRAHLAMLRVGWARGDVREATGQIARIAAAMLFSRIWVPAGNTGGADVSAFRSMRIPPDLADLLAKDGHAGASPVSPRR